MRIPTVTRYNESGDFVNINVGDAANLEYYAQLGYKFSEQQKPKSEPETGPEEIEETEDEEKPRRGRPAQKKR